MAEPTCKAKGLEDLLEHVFGRTSSIKKNHCIPPPTGCGKPVTGFRDALSEREYRISGYCQQCQDRVFGGFDEE